LYSQDLLSAAVVNRMGVALEEARRFRIGPALLEVLVGYADNHRSNHNEQWHFSIFSYQPRSAVEW
jgi:hypothetical protein